MVGLSLAVLGYPLVPSGASRDLVYDVLACLCLGMATWGLARQQPGRRGGWALLLGGFAAWVVGDLQFDVEQDLWHLATYPAPSDAVYLVGYALVAAGLLRIVRTRGGRANLALLLDAAIVATGTAVVVGVFVIVPISQDSSLDLGGKLVSSFYPVADVLLLGILVRMWASPGGRTSAFRLLTAGLATTLVADGAWNVTVVVTGDAGDGAWLDVIWLVSYLLIACAACSGSVGQMSEPGPAAQVSADPRRRMVALTASLLLPAVTLLVAGWTTGLSGWPVVAVGSLLLSGLVVARMFGLLGVVRAQAVQLSALARSDSLTGAPNRRTWDHELSRACQAARDSGEPLAVALIDLDHFKRYNDTHGHLAGDLVLREATAAWTELLSDGEVLARFGGEEFAVLLPGTDLHEARRLLQAMLLRTPSGQTFSAGVALWSPACDPASAVAAADDALYAAKRAGRNRVHLAAGTSAGPLLPELSIVLQPIVDLATAVPVAVEALSRFVGSDPVTVFREAHEAGLGPDLEAAAITAALAQRPATGLLSVNVGMVALTSPQVREALAGDLTGVMVEITEHHDTVPGADVARVVRGLRRRGAVIAVDDWGQGWSNLDRVLQLRPEVVKLDLSLVQALDSPYQRAMVASLTAWADEVGARICAEGIETDQQWHALQALGVHLGQGYLFGRPERVADPVDAVEV